MHWCSGRSKQEAVIQRLAALHASLIHHGTHRHQRQRERDRETDGRMQMQRICRGIVYNAREMT